MCGRFSQNLGRHQRAIHLFRRLGLDGFAIPVRFNIAPSVTVPVIRQPAPAPATAEFCDMRWGFVPSHARNASEGMRHINARIETVRDKPTFRDAFLTRRCLVPASGYYEWRRNGKARTPFYISNADPDQPLALAGIAGDWFDGSGGITTFAILTTEATAPLQAIHHRMPVCIAPDDWAEWLDPATPPDRLARFSRPGSAVDLALWEVDPYVNNARNEGERCCQPLTAD
ncbi:MAG: SOS response-associated peptidase [Planctomycetes bacterium]|nr:SOS response-associated peptidase [Planctomycetota bacterium]MCD7896291.1 SOS response-associated peptidase [Planctomycetaceae bacterium]